MKHVINEIEEMREHIDALPGPVQLILVRDAASCETCEELEQLVKKLTMVSSNFYLQTWVRSSDPEKVAQYGVDMTPALVINGIAGGRIRFYGVPTTSELTTFLRTIKDAAHGKIDLSPAVRHRFSNLHQPIHIRMLVPRTTIFCPDIVAMAEKLAFAYSQVTADVVNVRDFPELGKHFGAELRPKVLINDVDVPYEGDSETHFAEAVLRSVS